ncbi:DsbA family protein [Streptomyces sp. AJS327]|uniref:DsbA family protein n=1 Tax=Streptomyces sp. AJS327 TaxID=2545265 RepID=UPI0015DE7FD8|nr:DsbA family protein [Streptomyces sp. AJS327]MBA0053597.1 DsbA family protein [Streptomyces sp. AJS327]
MPSPTPKPMPKPTPQSRPTSRSGSGARSGSSSRSGSGSAPKNRKAVLIGAVVAVVALLVGWLSQYVVDDSGGSTPENATIKASEDEGGGDPALRSLERRAADDPFARGDKNAPVVMIEYADFGCSFCGKFARDTKPKLVKEYVDKGVLRVEWRNFTVFGKGSERAALASWAAGRQGRFWQFYDAVYAKESSAKSDFDDAELRGFAKDAGVDDLARFDRDRASRAAKKAVGRDQEEAYGLGANSTPVFLVNGEPIAGAQPDEVFTDAVDRAAKSAEKADKANKANGVNGGDGDNGHNEATGSHAAGGPDGSEGAARVSVRGEEEIARTGRTAPPVRTRTGFSGRTGSGEPVSPEMGPLALPAGAGA